MWMMSLKQTSLRCGLFIIGLPLLGLLYQNITNMLEARRYPPPGELIDVGGHRLHIYSVGQQGQGPTVVLEAGLSCSHLDWCKVQPEVAKFARVCSYDRTGLGWSETGPSTRSSSQMVTELHQLLTNANIPGPYILVAHSFGGFIVRLYADQ